MTNLDDGLQPPQGLRGPFVGSSLSARIAFILAFMGGIAWAEFAVQAIGKIRPDRNHFSNPSNGTTVYPESAAWAWWTFGVGSLAATLLLAGTAMIMMRVPASRIVIIIGCAVITAYSIFDIVADFRTRSQPVHDDVPFPLELCFVFVAFAVVTVAFALLPSTRRWLEFSQQSAQHSGAVER